MITKTNQKDAVIEYLERDKYIYLNALGHLNNNSESVIYLFNNDIENGVIIDGGEQEFFFLCTYDTGFMSEFWDSLPPGHKGFSGVPKPVAELFQKGKEISWQNSCKVFALKGTHERVQSDRYVCESLTAADAEEVDKFYTYRWEGSLDRIREYIVRRDSACVRIDGQLASWCTVHLEDNSMGPLYTKDEYRGSGLGFVVASDLICKLVAKNVIPFVHIVESNDISLHLANNLKGMEYSHDCWWFGVEKE